MNNIIGADIIMNGKSIVGSMGSDGKIHYDKEEIRELIAGESHKTTGKYNTTAYVTYRYDTSRKRKTDDVYELWKENGITKMDFQNWAYQKYRQLQEMHITCRSWFRLAKEDEKLLRTMEGI